MTPNIIAIDPGASGGIAWSDTEGGVHAEPMPDGMTAQCDRLRSIVAEMGNRCAILEKVGGYMPGNSGPAAATFARHCGHIEAALYCFAVPTQQVSPSVWQRALGFGVARFGPVADKQAAKAQNKRDIRDAMQRRYPHLTVTLKTADALAILTWATEKGGKR